MSDRVPGVSDQTIELLHNLSELPPDSAKLSRALASKKYAPLNFANAQQAISRLSRELQKRIDPSANVNKVLRIMNEMRWRRRGLGTLT